MTSLSGSIAFGLGGDFGCWGVEVKIVVEVEARAELDLAETGAKVEPVDAEVEVDTKVHP